MQDKSNLITRRTAIVSVLVAALSQPIFSIGEPVENLSADWNNIEKKAGGRLGCALLDTATGKRAGHRVNERFPMCSTFKTVATALVLQRVEKGLERLDRKVDFSSKDLVAYSPITGQHAGGEGMTVAELCQAAMTRSDNTAANLILKSFGGPPALNQFLRSIGDSVTRLDRTETALNEALPGDPRDTTTPTAMLENLQRLVLGNVLNSTSRATLSNWMMENETGATRLRAGLPKDWKVGDKTGSGDNGTTNDIAVIWLPRRAPVLVTAYLTGSPLSPEARDAILAEIGRSVAGAIESA
jgi:beta-lactamase class A